MKIERPVIRSKVISMAPAKNWSRWAVAKLECGHERVLDVIDDKTFDVMHGVLENGKWRDWSGVEVTSESEVWCVKCSLNAYKEALSNRPLEKAERFATREALLAKHPKAKWHEYGPVHRHGDKSYVQVYLGQHEWLAFNVDDVREVWTDPGWEGTEFGVAYLPEWHAEYAFNTLGTRGEIEPPERVGKPLTADTALFGDKAKLREYLDPSDPFYPKE